MRIGGGLYVRVLGGFVTRIGGGIDENTHQSAAFDFPAALGHATT